MKLLFLMTSLLTNFAWASHVDDVSKKDHHDYSTSSIQNNEWLAPNILTSKRIEYKFGSYGVQVREGDLPDTRLSFLYSVHDEKRVIRVIAFTVFENALPTALQVAHQQIIKGGSIGATLLNHGFKIKKEIISKKEIVLDETLVPDIHLAKGEGLPTLVYKLYVDVDDIFIHYCTIVECNRQAFLTMDELNKIIQESKSFAINEDSVGADKYYELLRSAVHQP